MHALSVVLSTTLALLFGGMVFFSAVMMPLVFTRLPSETAAGFARAAFPRYYLYILVLAGAATIAALPLALWAAIVLAAVTVLALYLREGLLPRIDSARQAGLTGDAGASTRFHRLHHISVLINLGQLIAVAVVFVILQW